MDANSVESTTALLRLLQDLTASNWQLFLSALALYAAWQLGTRVVGERPLYDHFPRLAAALDVVLMPLTTVVLGALLSKANRAFGASQLDGPIVWLTALAAYLIIGWALLVSSM
jgi:hypothetical protein